MSVILKTEVCMCDIKRKNFKRHNCFGTGTVFDKRSKKIIALESVLSQNQTGFFLNTIMNRVT